MEMIVTWHQRGEGGGGEGRGHGYAKRKREREREREVMGMWEKLATCTCHS